MSNAGGLKYCYKNFPWISKDKDAYTFNYQKSLISLTKLISRERERERMLQGIYGNLGGKNGHNMRFCTFQSNGFILAASSFIKTSSLLGLGMGTSTCCK